MVMEEYNEFEPYVESIRDAEFTFLIRQLENPIWSICHLDIGSIHVQFGGEGAGQLAFGNTRPDGWVFLIMRSDAPARVNSQSLPPGSVFVLPPDDDFKIATDKPHEWLSIFIPSELLSDETGKAPTSMDATGSRVIALNPQKLAPFLSQLERHMPSQGGASITDAKTIAEFKDLLIDSARNLINKPTLKPPERGRRSYNREDVINKAMHAINNAQVKPAIDALLEATGVSERTLRSIFHEYFGISPLSYMLLFRLHKARDMLRNPKNSQKTITSVATAIGFWDQGRFAEQYRKLFKELPSQTRERASKQ